MSFSSDVKKELAGLTDIPKHCAIAQLSAMAAFLGDADPDGLYFRGDKPLLMVVRELVSKNFKADESCFSLTNDADSVISPSRLHISDTKLSEDILMAIKWKDVHTQESGRRFSSAVLMKNECCRRAFLRGAFLCAGSVNDPHGAYHLEIVCKSEDEAGELAVEVAARVVEVGYDIHLVAFGIVDAGGDVHVVGAHEVGLLLLANHLHGDGAAQVEMLHPIATDNL